MQFSMISVKPMSLPPIVTETTLVAAESPLNCGGFGGGFPASRDFPEDLILRFP
jgi:hypothetical protein